MSRTSAKAVQPHDVEAARKRALRLLAVRARSCHEMRTRLAQAGFAQSTVEAVESRLAAVGLLNDAEFAAQVVRRAIELGKSSRLTGRDLRQMGIPAEVAEESMRELQEPGADEARARGLAEQKAAALRNVPAEKAVPRVVRHLCGRGYEPAVAWEVARMAFRDLEVPIN